MVEPLIGEQAVPTVMGVEDTLLQPAPALLAIVLLCLQQGNGMSHRAGMWAAEELLLEGS